MESRIISLFYGQYILSFSEIVKISSAKIYTSVKEIKIEFQIITLQIIFSLCVIFFTLNNKHLNELSEG